MVKIFYTYILLCSDDSFYTGITNNIQRRLNEHNSGKDPNSYTSSRRPVQLVFIRIFDRPMKAIRYEKQIKKWSRAKKVALITGNLKMLHDLAACKNETSHKFYDKKDNNKVK